MNELNIRKAQKTLNWIDSECYIDGVGLRQYLHDNGTSKLPEDMRSFDGLSLAWTKQLDFWGDVRFVWKLLEQEKAILPLYMCQDDLDFSCIVIVADVEKTKDYVYWDRIGLVQLKDYDFALEKKKGILDTDSYSEEDWELYGDNIALAEIDSDEWCRWISDYWDEELFRRRMNYTRLLYSSPQNILWFFDSDWEFERSQYEKAIDEYWISETLDSLSDYSGAELSTASCIDLVKKINRSGSEKLMEHKKDYGEVLLHIYLCEEIGEPLFALLKSGSHSGFSLIYSKIIELLWQYGDAAVKNVVDVTLLERLSDEDVVWNRFGKLISEEFRQYINGELLLGNCMMWGVKPIKG